MSDHPHPPVVEMFLGAWPCSVCSTPIAPGTTVASWQWECTTCGWRGRIAIACSGRCAKIVADHIAPALRGQKGGDA